MTSEEKKALNDLNTSITRIEYALFNSGNGFLSQQKLHNNKIDGKLDSIKTEQVALQQRFKDHLNNDENNNKLKNSNSMAKCLTNKFLDYGVAGFIFFVVLGVVSWIKTL